MDILQCSLIWLNTSLIVLSLFVDMINVYSQLTVYKGNYSPLVMWLRCLRFDKHLKSKICLCEEFPTQLLCSLVLRVETVYLGKRFL